MKKRDFIFIVLLILYLSCAGGKNTVKEEDEKGKPEDVVKTFEPLSMLKDDVDIPPPKWEAKEIDYELLLPPELKIADALAISLEEMVQGWRVQIGIFTTVDDAIEIADKARDLLDVAVYLEFDAPRHKVRVGDCNSRKDAMVLFEKVKKLRFFDALIIPTRVYKYPELRKQRELEKKEAEVDTVNAVPKMESDVKKEIKN